MGREFVYTQPVKIIFGESKFAMLGSLLEELGVQKCVIACGKHFAPTALAMQEEDSRIAAVFGGVEQNPQLSGAIETARLAREVKADTVVGVGGGSAIDTAKFAAAIALGDRDAEDYYRGKVPVPSERLTVIAVPTTAGTGSEVTQVSVMSHGTEKRTINNANILCMGGWIVGPEMAVEMVKTFLNTDWCQDLEDWRAVNMHKFAAKVDEIEANIYGA